MHGLSQYKRLKTKRKCHTEFITKKSRCFSLENWGCRGYIRVEKIRQYVWGKKWMQL